MKRADFLKQKGTTYSNWFGEGDLINDLQSAEIDKKKKAKRVFRDGFMILIDFGDSFVCKGYDGNEYRHCFIFGTK
jgi:hypothetical protein